MKQNMIKDLSKDAARFLSRKGYLRTYEIHEEILQNLISKYPDHKNYAAVSVKVKLLNLFYSTGIKAIDAMVENILRIENIDQLLNGVETCAELVNAIAGLKLSDGKERKNYSFATKYCALHQPAKYPIYDSIVASVFASLMKQGRLLPYSCKTTTREKSDEFYMTQGEFKEKMHDYNEYLKIYNTFMEDYGLTNLTYREVDRYLWAAYKDGTFKTEIERMAKIPRNKYTEYAEKKITGKRKIHLS